jgi:predicted TIM-barrel fold metal-dependent hydrolase
LRERPFRGYGDDDRYSPSHTARLFWRETNDSHAPVGGLAPLRWSKEAMISFMDDAGIDVAVMSVSTPGVHLGDSEKARSLARRCNEFAAELVHTRPARFAIIDEMAFIPGGEERGTAASMFRRMYWDTAVAAAIPCSACCAT